MKHNSYGATDLGMRRASNEDYLHMERLSDEVAIYMVCDGIGGQASGEVASKLTAEVSSRVLRADLSVLEKYAGTPSFKNRLAAIQLLELSLETACREIHDMSLRAPEHRGMGSTVVLLALMGNHAIITHAGDSRAYLIRDGHVYQLTDDHSMIAEQLRRGLISPDEAAKSHSGSVITRAIGDRAKVEPDSLHLELAAGDLFLLCTDGFSNYFSVPQIKDMVREAELPDLPMHLIDQANAKGGRDNITCVCVRIEELNARSLVDPVTKTRTLQKIPLFSRLSYRELLRVLSMAHEVAFSTGEIIIKEGTMGGGLFITLDGAVEVTKKDQVLAKLGQGSFFGEMGLIDNAPRSADIVAAAPSKMLVIERGDFYDLLRQNPVLSVRLLWSFCQVLNTRLRSTSDELADAKGTVTLLADEPVDANEGTAELGPLSDLANQASKPRRRK